MEAEYVCAKLVLLPILWPPYLPGLERVVWHRRSLDSISAVDRKLILYAYNSKIHAITYATMI